MMDTTELGAGMNPVPDEPERTVKRNGTITISYIWEDEEFPESWDNKKIEEYIQENWTEYTQQFMIIEDITIKN